MNEIELFMMTKSNRPKDLKIWADYHLSIGFDKIIIMDNDSEFSVSDLFKNYKKVEVREVHGLYRPWADYADKAQKMFQDICYERKPYTKWISIIDDDEYVYPGAVKNIKDYLDKDYPVLCMFWKMISLPEVLDDRSTSLIETFNYVSPLNTPWDNKIFIKSIINTTRFNKIQWLDPHMALIDGKGIAYTYEGEFIPNPYMILNPSFYQNKSSLILYHFYHQSYSDRLYKVSRCNSSYRPIEKEVFISEIKGKYTELDNRLMRRFESL
jgi:hypothetical protein